MNVKQIASMEFEQVNKLDRKSLSKLVSSMGSAINKRVKRMEAADIDSPALRGLQKSGGNISVKGKNVNQLRAEFLRAKTFLEAKTSSFAGVKAVQKSFEKRVGGAMSPGETKTFWQAYNKLAESQPALLKSYGSQQAQQYLRETMAENPGGDSEDYLGAMQEHMKELYETLEEEEAEQAAAYETESDFFELGEDL